MALVIEADEPLPPRGWIGRLLAINVAIASVLFAALTVVVTLQVVTRFILHLPFLWSEELARFLFIWVVMLGASMGVRNRRHFVVDVTMGRTQRLGPKGRLLFDVIPDACVLAFSIFLLVVGVGYAQSGLLRTATHSGISMGLVYYSIVVFAVLSVVYALTNLLRDIAAFAEGRSAVPTPTPGAE